METRIGTDGLEAKQLLESGDVVAIPTETVYGLAANALDARAVTKIFEAKNRPFFDPLIIHTYSIEQIKHFVLGFPRWAEELAEKFMPGPLTIVLKKGENIPDIVTAGLDTVGIRIPNHQVTLDMLRSLQFPLAAPSANPFGYISPTNPNHVLQQLAGKIPYILDGGECSVGIESTIVGEEKGTPVILRLGGTSIEDIQSVIGKCELRIHSSSNPKNPGSLESHYSPKHRLIFSDENPHHNQPSEIGTITFKQTRALIPLEQQRILSPSGDLKEAARRIFSAMRDLDAMRINAIWAEKFPDVGLGRAINDRLRRAAS